MAQDDLETLCNKAQQAIAQGLNDQARQLYLQALALRFDNPDVHYGLGTVCFLLNDLTNAAHHFREVTRLDPLRAGAYVNLGAVYNRLDQLDEAVATLRRGIQLDKNRAEGFYNLGLVCRRKGQPELAIQAYREAVRINPRMGDAHYNLGNLYLEKEQYPLAVVHYKHALEMRPNWDKALHGLEQALEAQRGHERPAIPNVRLEPTGEGLGRANLDPERMIDANVQGPLLSTLHKATIDSNASGLDFLRIVEAEVEPAIKELSSCLLYPNSSSRELDECMQKFESAIGSMRQAQDQLRASLERVRAVGEKLINS
jgi:tetratricopeptide (TPR) repeat protein